MSHGRRGNFPDAGKVKCTIRKHRVLLCRNPLLRAAEFIRRGETPGSTTAVRFRRIHAATVSRPPWTRALSSPGSNKGNGEEEKFIAAVKESEDEEGEEGEEEGAGKVVAIGTICFYGERKNGKRKRENVWRGLNADESPIPPIRSGELHFRDASDIESSVISEGGKSRRRRARRSYESPGLVRLSGRARRTEMNRHYPRRVSRAIILLVKQYR